MSLFRLVSQYIRNLKPFIVSEPGGSRLLVPVDSYLRHVHSSTVCGNMASAIPGAIFVDEKKTLTKSQKKRQNKKKNKLSQNSEGAGQDQTQENETRSVSVDSQKVPLVTISNNSVKQENESKTIGKDPEAQVTDEAKPIINTEAAKPTAATPETPSTTQVTEDLAQLNTNDADTFNQNPGENEDMYFQSAQNQARSKYQAPARHHDGRDSSRKQKHQGPPGASGSSANRDRSRSHSKEGRGHGGENQQRQKGKERKRKSRFDDDGTDAAQHGSGRSHGGQQNQKQPADPHRDVVDKMSYYLRNPKAAHLEAYYGAVYTEQLAGVIGIAVDELSMIAKKFDKEFSIWTDDSGYSNISLRRSNRREDDQDTALSKKLSALLRHRAQDKGFQMLEGGFLFVEDILKRGEFKQFKLEDVQRIVQNNDKQRFKIEIDDKTKKPKIRANQGHSMKIENLELRALTGKDVPHCVHGTSFEAWGAIKSTGLKTMGRNHVHFAPGEPGESGVISGMRASCQVLVFVDMDKAIADGIKFEMSANNVILSEGDKFNTISPKYFKKVIDRKTRKPLTFGQAQVERQVSSKDGKKQEKAKGGKSEDKGKPVDKEAGPASTST